jgi:ferredoxin
MSQTIPLTGIKQLVGQWLGQGKRVSGPSRVNADTILYMNLDSPDGLLLEGFVHPGNSLKEFVLPPHEKLYDYVIKGRDVELRNNDAPAPERLIIGARPCDAAALPILDHIFNWDYIDEPYNRRRNALTTVTLACASHDDACFCTSLGLAPDAERGSDAILFALGNAEYEVRCLTPKGEALFAGKCTPSDRKGSVPPGPPKHFDAKQIEAFVAGQFDSPVWREEALACMGCGACSYGCPTCHCFDIVDERNAGGGIRARNWDACQFPLFTLHASGHNPRKGQSSRQRQRIYHKFRIYPEKFKEYLCTGCGNCVRRCPAGLGLLSMLTAIRETGAQAQKTPPA